MTKTADPDSNIDTELPSKYINPFTDYGFKRLFGESFSKAFLIDFLSELLKDEIGPIETLEYLNVERLGPTELDRGAVFDLSCKNQAGEYFIIELQKARQNYFKDRSVYYATFPIQSQAKRGRWDFNLKAVYSIGILDFVFKDGENKPEVVSRVKLCDLETKQVFYDKLTFAYIEMPKFNKTEAELESHFDKWLYILKNLEDLQSRPKRLQERIFKKLFEAAEIAKFDPAQRLAYEDSLKSYRDMKNVLDTAIQEAQAKADRAEAKADKAEAKLSKTIQSLKQNGMAIDQISDITGLTATEISKRLLENTARPAPKEQDTREIRGKEEKQP